MKQVIVACVDAALTAYAFRLLIGYLRTGAPALRVMTPHTTQRASLHEDGCPNARPVINGIALDVEDEHFFPVFVAKVAFFLDIPKENANFA